MRVWKLLAPRTRILHGMLKTVTLALLLAFRPGGLPDVDPVADAIRRQLESAGQPLEIHLGSELIHAAVALPAFYERNGFAPAWSKAGRFTPNVRQFLDAVAASESEGLRSSDYHLSELEQRIATGRTNPERLAETDLLLTDAFLILAAHIVSGRVAPETFDAEWIATRREVDVTAVLQRVVNDGESPSQALRELRPHYTGYGNLVKALARYRRIEADGGWPRIGPGASLKVGETDAAVPRLRRRLAITDDLAPTSAVDPLSEIFDEELVAAVIRFQRRHGLDDDGVVGAKTREALDIGAGRRARTIELNLERWRWLPQELGRRHLLVNVPRFRLHVAEGEKEVLAMRVIVGRAVRRTPVFSDTMRYLVFSPSWEVPPTILRQDKLPLLRKNPGYAAEQNMHVFEQREGRWVETDVNAIDWSRANASNIRLRQQPGPNNALGLVKFMFPNPFSIYLHDTPSRELFARSQRDFSSGCIRIEQPAELAHYLLRDDPRWTPEAIRAAMVSGKERSVTLSEPIPVHIQYWTAWAEDDGAIAFGPDIYNRDVKLDAALRLPPPTGDEE